MIGGDSFLELTNVDDHEIVVIGYRGEPYLRFEADGRVLENEISPSRFLNDDRFGETEVPPEADPDAPPVWREVSSDGEFAWHDHRTHWMNRARPPGAEPGDQILEAVVPIVVDGTEVAVTVRSFWLPAPSPVPAIAGVVLGVVAAGAALLVDRRRGTGWSALVALVAAIAATATGLLAFTSVPSETGPSMMLWLLPTLATVVIAAGADLRRRYELVGDGLILLGAIELVVWAWTRGDAVTSAVIPTDAPASLDRAVIMFAATVGLVVAGGRIAAMLRPTPALAT